MAFTSDLRAVAWPAQDAAGLALERKDLGETTLGQSSDSSEAPPQATGPGVVRRPRPPKLYRMAEVVDYSGLSRQTVHNYTTMGLLREVRRTDGGHRLYDESVFQRLDEVAAMRAGGMSIQEIREHFAPVDEAGEKREE
jgi:hypothetical protein